MGGDEYTLRPARYHEILDYRPESERYFKKKCSSHTKRRYISVTGNRVKRNIKKAETIEGTKNVNVIIPLEKGSWEKKYDKEDLLGTVINDFLAEKLENIPRFHIFEWTFNNEPIQLQDKLKTLLKEGSNIVCLNKELKRIPLDIQDNEENFEFIGRPFCPPFKILLFNKKMNSFTTIPYKKEDIESLELDNYNYSSAYCNGNDHLYISGGEDKNSNVLDLFWDIDLKTHQINQPVKTLPKRKHSILYFSEKIFTAGGDDNKTFYYDLQTKHMSEWGNLNLIRIEPSLIKCDNFLYCFDAINKGPQNKFNLEKTNLASSSPKWELIEPRMSIPSGEEFDQLFFGVSKDIDGNIIFLGGNNGGLKPKGEKMNFRYNIRNNCIEASDVPFQPFELDEKTFLCYNKKIDIILPDFNLNFPQIVGYDKELKKLEILHFKKKETTKEKKVNQPTQNLSKKYSFNLKAFRLNYNMPKPGDVKEENNFIQTPSFNELDNKEEEKESEVNMGQIEVNFKEENQNENGKEKEKEKEIEIENEKEKERSETVFPIGVETPEVDIKVKTNNLPQTIVPKKEDKKQIDNSQEKTNKNIISKSKIKEGDNNNILLSMRFHSSVNDPSNDNLFSRNFIHNNNDFSWTGVILGSKNKGANSKKKNKNIKKTQTNSDLQEINKESVNHPKSNNIE